MKRPLLTLWSKFGVEKASWAFLIVQLVPVLDGGPHEYYCIDLKHSCFSSISIIHENKKYSSSGLYFEKQPVDCSHFDSLVIDSQMPLRQNKNRNDHDVNCVKDYKQV